MGAPSEGSGEPGFDLIDRWLEQHERDAGDPENPTSHDAGGPAGTASRKRPTVPRPTPARDGRGTDQPLFETIEVSPDAESATIGPVRPSAGDPESRSSARRSIARDIFDAVNADDADAGADDLGTDAGDAPAESSTPPGPAAATAPRTPGAEVPSEDDSPSGADRRARLQRMLEEKRRGREPQPEDAALTATPDDRPAAEPAAETDETDETVEESVTAPRSFSVAPRMVPDPLTAPLHELEPDWAPQQPPVEQVEPQVEDSDAPEDEEPAARTEPEELTPDAPSAPDPTDSAPEDEQPEDMALLPDDEDDPTSQHAAVSPEQAREQVDDESSDPTEDQIAEPAEDTTTAATTDGRVDVFAALREPDEPVSKPTPGLSDQERRARLARMLREKRGQGSPGDDADTSGPASVDDPATDRDDPGATPPTGRRSPTSPLDLLARSMGVDDGGLPARSYGTERAPVEPEGIEAQTVEPETVEPETVVPETVEQGEVESASAPPASAPPASAPPDSASVERAAPESAEVTDEVTHPATTAQPPDTSGDVTLEPALAAMLRAMEEQEAASRQKKPGARADRRGSRKRRGKDTDGTPPSEERSTSTAPAATPPVEPAAVDVTAEQPLPTEPESEPAALETPAEQPMLPEPVEAANVEPAREPDLDDSTDDGADDPAPADTSVTDKPMSLEEIIAAATTHTTAREPRRPQTIDDVAPPETPAAAQPAEEPTPDPQPEPVAQEEPEPEPEPEPATVALEPEPEPLPQPPTPAPAAPAAAVPTPTRPAARHPERRPAQKSPKKPQEPQRRVAPATKDVPPVVEFAPQRATQQLLGMLLAVAFIGTVATAYLAYDDRTTTNIAIAATMGLLTLILWSAHGSADPARLKVDRGVLDIRGKDSHHSFDLASPYTDLEVKGTPGRRGWKVLIQRRSMPPYVIDDSMVDSREFMKVLDHYRPER